MMKDKLIRGGKAFAWWLGPPLMGILFLIIGMALWDVPSDLSMWRMIIGFLFLFYGIKIAICKRGKMP